MKHSFLALRAIATTFAGRLYLPVVIIVAVSAIVVTVLLIWLLTISAWWWLLAIPVFGIFIIATVLLILVRIVLNVIAPNVTKAQRIQINVFIDHIQELSEITQTPKVFLLYRIIKDAVSPRKTAYIESVISNAGSLKNEYRAIVTSFSE